MSCPHHGLTFGRYLTLRCVHFKYLYPGFISLSPNQSGVETLVTHIATREWEETEICRYDLHPLSTLSSLSNLLGGRGSVPTRFPAGRGGGDTIHSTVRRSVDTSGETVDPKGCEENEETRARKGDELWGHSFLTFLPPLTCAVVLSVSLPRTNSPHLQLKIKATHIQSVQYPRNSLALRVGLSCHASRQSTSVFGRTGTGTWVECPFEDPWNVSSRYFSRHH